MLSTEPLNVALKVFLPLRCAHGSLSTNFRAMVTWFTYASLHTCCDNTQPLQMATGHEEVTASRQKECVAVSHDERAFGCEARRELTMPL